MVEHLISNQNVEGSTPFTRSITYRGCLLAMHTFLCVLLDRKLMKTKVALLRVWMVVFALAALCFMLPVLAAIPFVIASAVCALGAGLLHKAAKEANCRQ